MEGYATYFKLVELVAKEGEKGRLSFGKYSINLLSSSLRMKEDRLQEILNFMAEINLCCLVNLKKECLYFPKLMSRADDYTKRALRENKKVKVSYDPEMTRKFEDIWARYPLRLNKKAAERHFHAHVKKTEDWNNINKALSNYIYSKPVRDNYIQNGSTWFNNWRDWIDYKEDGDDTGRLPEDIRVD